MRSAPPLQKAQTLCPLSAQKLGCESEGTVGGAQTGQIGNNSGDLTAASSTKLAGKIRELDTNRGGIAIRIGVTEPYERRMPWDGQAPRDQSEQRYREIPAHAAGCKRTGSSA